MQIPFATTSSNGRIRPESVQQLINLYPELAPQGEKTPVVLIGTPGQSLLGTIDAGACRGAHVMNEQLFVVAGTTVYLVSAGGVGTALGTIPGSGLVSMADNGSQLMIVNNSNAGYIVSGGTVTQITDPDFPGAGTVCFIDGYFIINAPASKRFYISALNNGLAWDALDFSSADATPDNIVHVENDHRELWIFKKQHIEVWSNTGASPFPFERIGGTFIERGSIAPDSVISGLDNSLFWLGDDKIVYRAAGYSPQRISTHAIEYRIAQVANAGTARAFGYSQEGHAFYVLTFPGVMTLVYDAATGAWHDRQTFGLPDWQPVDHAFVYGRNIVVDGASGNVLELSLDVFTDNGATIQRRAIAPSIWNGAKRVTMSAFQIDFQVGNKLLRSGVDIDAQAMLDWSNDGGNTWSNEHWAGLGQVGQYRARAIWNRLGQFRQRNYRVTVSDPIPVRILGAYGEAVGGLE